MTDIEYRAKTTEGRDGVEYNPTPQPKSGEEGVQKQIPEQLGMLAHELSELEHKLDELTKQLQPVLSEGHQSVKVPSAVGNAQDQVCPVANGIRVNRLLVMDISERIRNLLMSLEL